MPPKRNKEDRIKWTSEHRGILTRALEEDGYLFGRDISFEEAFAHYSTRREFADVVFSQFKERLGAYMKKDKEKNGWITNWRNSAAGKVLIEDLEPGGLLFEKDDVSAEEAFGFYRTLPEFASVVFSQFKERLEAHRGQANAEAQVSQAEVRTLAHDRVLFPRQGHNARGEPVFDMSAAKPLLREDVANKLQMTMTPSELQATRQEYSAFKPYIFKQRIFQEVRLQKFYHFYDLQREKKKHSKGKSGDPRSHTFSQGN
jgi:hypothetical protein